MKRNINLSIYLFTLVILIIPLIAQNSGSTDTLSNYNYLDSSDEIVTYSPSYQVTFNNKRGEILTVIFADSFIVESNMPISESGKEFIEWASFYYNLKITRLRQKLETCKKKLYMRLKEK